jgi:type IV pilus assembly protein PilM
MGIILIMDFLNLKPENFGLDISDLSLKIIKLKKRRSSFVLSSFGEYKIKPGIIKEGEIKDEKKLAGIIREAVKEVKGEKLKTKYVVVSLPEEKSFLQVIQMPKMPEEDLKSAVVYEAENYIPLPIEEVYLDFQIISPIVNGLDHLDILLVALPRKIVDPYLSCLKLAGLQPTVFETESLAIARSLIKNEIATSSVSLIDLGATRTSFTVFSGKTVRFTSSIPVSSQSFTEVISKNLRVNLTEAERLKLKYGLEEKIKLEIKKNSSERIKKKGKIFEALIPALVDLAQQVKKHLDYYQTHVSHEHLPPNGKTVSKVLLCGGGVNLKGLPELLSLELKIPVELGNPWVNIFPEGKKEALELPFEKSLGYTTAIGLALRGIRKD